MRDYRVIIVRGADYVGARIGYYPGETPMDAIREAVALGETVEPVVGPPDEYQAVVLCGGQRVAHAFVERG